MDVAVQQEVLEQTHGVHPASPKKRPFDELNGTILGSNTESLAPSPASMCQTPKDHADTRRQKRDPSPSPLESMALAQPHATEAQSISAPVPLTVNISSGPSCNILSEPAPSPPSQPSLVPNKKRRLSPASKEAKAQEKARKEEARKLWEEEKKRKEEEKEEEKRKREELKKKKEEEKEQERRRREDEKRKKDEEKETERRKREEKKKQKEEEKLAREEEKKKKERSQMRLNAFFVKPVAATTNKTSAPDTSNKNSSKEAAPAAGSEVDNTKAISDYENEFPPFFIHSHMRVGTPHRFERDSEALLHVREKLDVYLKNTHDPSNLSLRPSELFKMIPYKRRFGKMESPTVKEIVSSMNDSNDSKGAVIDLTAEKDAGTDESAQSMLKKIPMKLLHFKEDVRPPYQGTFTKRLPDKSAFKLCRNPFSRAIPDFNYDYDSEAEWEEPEEGEDLDSEGEEDVSDDDDEDMDDFLDDGDDELSKRKMIVGDLEPVCTGICWADGNKANEYMNSFRMEVLSETGSLPIDPFSDAYWKKPTSAPQSNLRPVLNASTPGKAPDSSKQTSMQSNNAFLTPALNPRPTSALPGMNTTSNGPGAGLKLKAHFPSELISEFKQAVSGSDLTKAGLIEILKKRFPKVSKEVIRDTLTTVAVRQGKKEADKRWMLI
ncbi:chromatin assembly factor 1 subunit A [Coccidioides immitis RS]|uniref:Chromatin assembly factor 1 subunit A n=3 Tax=Coccidioides immitis TaxID=5501 RepID=J3K8G4_COCIM|nr:chromatin assembly factor 1 subunit A [Coccidioides immitis RS]EAS31108.3 chromatin assembly factor 1 subunit A [Coccidioides immitis RS]KMP03717.1 hypothetical protein CIRG_03409 [Coccidioides immitis RMSCC 2394]KMU83216.1 hypothetical protein CIHG_00998 [Coccidioides immitis H538.4]TPX23960.1 hypothetical protein DIZ76_013303 [Coccidioides immitis]